MTELKVPRVAAETTLITENDRLARELGALVARSGEPGVDGAPKCRDDLAHEAGRTRIARPYPARPLPSLSGSTHPHTPSEIAFLAAR